MKADLGLARVQRLRPDNQVQHNTTPVGRLSQRQQEGLLWYRRGLPQQRAGCEAPHTCSTLHALTCKQGHEHRGAISASQLMPLQGGSHGQYRSGSAGGVQDAWTGRGSEVRVCIAGVVHPFSSHSIAMTITPEFLSGSDLHQTQ